MKKIAGMEL
jgi:hypothetical protein